ncbi:iron-siderophore ABC transporter substrate-binding protein [Saccharospirillum salsuginis]|uniref:ABC transporter substrate-binding protein n=1 Tax=Saccharospirillum salsuginis TaxID=418750 RepID=A0A918N9X5_9GAMM|nr:iron-siderophore ABC transporter substrate-binding protein [Saccharospirillum salsuginis]GGX54944.1 ABC transporter substrate-binding protein [Saccharospirillum salsuginis]
MKQLWIRLLTAVLVVGATQAADFPVTIEHKFGATTIPVEPDRIVSVGYTEQDDLFALGKAPVAIRPWGTPMPHGVWPWAEEAAKGAEPTVLGRGPLDFEAIAALDPDLIIGIYAGVTEEDYKRLSLIAPTVLQPGDYVDYATPWEEQTRIIGRAVGKAEEADALVEGIKARFAQTRSEHPEFEGKTVAAAFFWDGQVGAYTSGEPRSRFFTELGMVIPEVYDEESGDAFYATFSLERIHLLDVDFLAWYWDSPEGALASNEVQRLRQTLGAYQDDREMILPARLRWALSFSSPLSLDYALDELVPVLSDRL